MKNTILFLLLAVSTLVNATEYRMVVPFAAGAQSDVAARAIAQSFENLTGDKIVVENFPGADSIIGINHFKNNQDIDIIMTSSSIVSYNPAIRDDLPYSDSTFDHIIFVGTSPTIWLSDSKGKLKTINDLMAMPPAFVGGNSSAGQINVQCFAKEKGNVTYVPFKGAPDVPVNVINGSTGAGVMSVSTTLIELAKAGKVIVLGSSYKSEIDIDGVTIPSIPEKTGLKQLNGFLIISLRPNMNTERANQLKRGLWSAMQESSTKEKLKKLYILPDKTNDVNWISKHIQEAKIQSKTCLKNK